MKLTLQQITFVSLIVLSPTLASLAHTQGGVPLWTNRYAGPGSYVIGAPHVAVDRNGNVFVAGDSPYPAHYGTVKYSNTGVPLWTATTVRATARTGLTPLRWIARGTYS